ncbi:unnamed protein product, partial [Meganyctiphanes norvegica]
MCAKIKVMTIVLLSHTSYIFDDESFMDGQLTLLVEDSLDGGPDPEFSLRSTIHVRSVKSGNAFVTHTRTWTDECDKKLKTLADNDDMYRVRVYQKGAEDRGYVSTFTNACQVYESGLSETLTLMLDGAGSSVASVGLFPPIAVCTGEGPITPPQQYNTTIIIRSPIMAPVPDTATYITKMEAMKSEKAEGKDNRSFLAKYWMYIVPIVLVMLLSGGAQEGTR